MRARMRWATTLSGVIAVIGFSMTADPSARPLAAASPLQQKAAPPKAGPSKAAPSKAAPATKGGAAPVAPFHNDIPLKSIPAKNPIPMSDTSVKAGRVVFAKICRACHGLAG